MYEVKPNQSVELLKELHILTRDGKMNQDSRRKLKQIYHLYQFIEPLLQEIQTDHPDINLVDHGAETTQVGARNAVRSSTIAEAIRTPTE